MYADFYIQLSKSAAVGEEIEVECTANSPYKLGAKEMSVILYDAKMDENWYKSKAADARIPIEVVFVNQGRVYP